MPRFPVWLRWFALPFLFLFWFCQNPETDADHIWLTPEADSSYQDFSRLRIDFIFEGETDTLLLFNDSLKTFEDLHRLTIPNRGSGKGRLLFRGFESGGSRLVYSEIRVIDLANGNLISVTTQLDLRTTVVTSIPGAPTIRFPFSDTLISIGDTLTLSAILLDSGGQLRSYAWDFTGNQGFTTAFSLDQASDTVYGTYTFRDTGTHAISLKVINENRRETLKSLTVRVGLDVPTAMAIADSVISVGDTIRLHGVGKDSLGRVKEMAWKIGDGAYQISAKGDTAFTAPLLPGSLTAVFRVMDDDGLFAYDSVIISLRPSSSAYLKALSIREASLSQGFDWELRAYTATVLYEVAEIHLDFRLAQADAQINIAGRNLASGDTSYKVELKVGPTTIPILVTAQDKKTQRNYELFVTRLPNADATLKDLAPSLGNLSPKFSQTTFKYTLELENNQGEVTLTPSATDDVHAQIRVKNVITASGHASQPIALSVGTDTIPVEVRAQNDSARLNYLVIVTRKASSDATLKGLKPSHGPLSPSLASSIRQYTDTVPGGISKVTLIPIANSEFAKIWVQGKEVVSGQPSDSLSLLVGDNAIRILVKAQNGDSLAYLVTFHRPDSEARLSNIQVDAGTLTPAFDPDRFQYTDTVASTVTAISVKATALSPVRSVRIQDTAVSGLSGSRNINLSVGDNVISVVGIGEDGTRRQYQLMVHRKSGDASLTALSCNPTLPRVILQSSIFTYGDTVDYGVDTLRVLAQASHAKATLLMNGAPLTSGQYSSRLTLLKGMNSFVVKVVAEDTAITKTYTLNIARRRGYIKIIGGPAEESGIWLSPTSDGGFVIAGSAIKTTGQPLDALLLKVNAAGDTLWSKSFGGAGKDGGNGVVESFDHGFLLAGTMVPPARTDLNLYWVKTDSSGTMAWEKNTGGISNEGDYGAGVQMTRDGGYILCSQTASYGAGGTDIYVVKVNSSGDTTWTRPFGGTGNDVAFSIQQTSDDGFILVGRTQVTSGANNLFLLKLKANGDTLWSRSLGGTGGAIGVSVALTADKGFILTGQNEAVGGGDVYLIKTDSLGLVTWSRTYGGSGADWGRAVQQTVDGGYIVAGLTANSFFGPNNGGQDALLLRFNSIGDPLWQKVYGGGGDDNATSVRQTVDGGFVMVGTINSAQMPAINKNILLIRTDDLGNSN